MINDLYFSDLHDNREGVSDELRQLITKAKKDESRLFSVGDLLNILPLGPDGWRRWIEEFEELLDGYPFYYICGNHDPPRYVKRLFAHMPNVVVLRRLTMPEGVHLRHGHGWAPDWWLLRHIAPTIVEFMTEHFPKPWYWFSKKMGWLPGELKAAGIARQRDYAKEVSFLWRQGMKYAQRHNVTVVSGHTHCQGGCVGEPGMVFVVDCGAAKDGAYLAHKTQGIERRNLYDGVR